jgi:hypothetical protein
MHGEAKNSAKITPKLYHYCQHVLHLSTTSSLSTTLLQKDTCYSFIDFEWAKNSEILPRTPLTLLLQERMTHPEECVPIELFHSKQQVIDAIHRQVVDMRTVIILSDITGYELSDVKDQRQFVVTPRVISQNI